MKSIELREEEKMPPSYKNVKRDRSSQATKKIMFALEEVPREVRKKEAGQPLYLIRYE